MIAIPGYQIRQQIYESHYSLVYRARRLQDNQAVILKVLKQEYPTPDQLSRYREEYELISSLNLDGVIEAYSLDKYHNRLVMCLEDFGGKSLKLLLNDKPLQVSEFLLIAVQLAEALGQIHQQQIIHKDINPSNIIWNPTTGQLKIIDLGISTVFSRKNPVIQNPTVLEGTLAYMSPEQTGRMNRSLDYRADFYSLGATFYELLTGKLPFDTNDPLELVHAHMAKAPVPPHEVNSEIPPVISHIVMKLLAKTAEERYQSAWGIKADLETCLTQLRNGAQISPFPLAKMDRAGKFSIPQKLYGREQEIKALLTAFERISLRGQSEMTVVAGYSGIGKSALMEEIYQPITQSGSYFIKGNFKQFQRNVPYSALVKAFSALMRQILTESEEDLNRWREELRAAFGPNGQLIIDVIPEMELIVGPQPPVQELEPTEAHSLCSVALENRFHLLMQNFIHVFCKPEHPLVIFLDDLQWADLATLKLLEVIMTDEHIRDASLFLIGAYRDHEMTATHPLMMTLDSLSKKGAIINQMTLAPLTKTDITQLMAETLHCDEKSLAPLAELLLRKTGGNPFFVSEFLKTLYQEKLFTFDFESFKWQWDVAQIEAIGITDNVIELMIGKFQKLPLPTQQVLRLAACVGNRFDLETLSFIHRKPLVKTRDDLLPAIQEGLILASSEKEASEAESKRFVTHYQFQHDRVQQAAYALMDEQEKKAIHLKIGRLLWIEERPEQIFELVDHLNIGRELITSEHEKLELVRLNVEAGQKAKDATAYAAAKQYLTTAMACLSDNSWREQYQLTLEVYKTRAKAEYLNGHFEQSEALIKFALTNAKSALDKAAIYYLLIVQYTLLAKYQEAIQAGRNALGLFRIYLPENKTQTILQKHLFQINEKLPNYPISLLVNKKEILNPKGRAVMRLLATMIPASYILDRDLFSVITAKATYFSLAHGHVVESAGIYSSYALLLVSWGGYRSGYEFGLLSLKLSEKYNDLSQKCKSCQAIVAHLNHWVNPLNSSYAITKDGCQAGMESGEFQYVAYSFVYEFLSLFYQGSQLALVVEKLQDYLAFSQETRNQFAVDVLSGGQLALSTLMAPLEQTKTQSPPLTPPNSRGGKSPPVARSIGRRASGRGEKASAGVTGHATKSEAQYLDDWEANQNMTALCIYYIFKQQIFYLDENLHEALQYTRKAETLLSSIPAVISVAQHNFYYSLILIGLYTSASIAKQKEYWQQLEINQEQLRVWADHCPDNFLNMYLLVEAEMARISGKTWKDCANLYDNAIESARENKFIQHEALANELAGKFWLEQGQEKFAKLYLTEAHYGYQLWGAKRKVQDLEKKYGHLLMRASSLNNREIDSTLTRVSTGNQSDEVLDLATVMKASQAISGEIVLEDLLSKMIKIVMQNAGAQRGFLILEQDGQWVIETEGAIVQEEVTVLESLSLGSKVPSTSQLSGPPLPKSIINYIARTQEYVVLNDATHEGPFTQDPYIKANQPKSILCAPLINQGQLSGMLYLENNLTTGAFTPQRLKVLNLLSTQAAISIENARLYHTLEEKVEERTAQLAHANEEIRALNTRLQAENTRLEAEVDVVRKVQQMILPTQEELQEVDGLDIASFMEAADEVGGDYLDVLQHKGRIKIGIGDVTGHGLESGVLMLMTQMGVRTLLTNEEHNATRFMSVLNRTIYDNVQRMETNKSLTLALLDYTPLTSPLKLGGSEGEAEKAAGQLIVSGQHEEMIVVRKGGQVELIDTFDLGFPIGLDDDIADFIDQQVVLLEPGDGVVLYTDGITEAENMDGTQYELERLCEVVSRHWEEPAEAIKNAVIADLRSFIGQQKVHDDITLLVLKQK